MEIKSTLIKTCGKFFSDMIPRTSQYWLILREQKYGGYISNVKRQKVSPLDPRSPETLQKGGMQGGDRMLVHGYSKKYAEYLKPFIKPEKKLVLIECGILKGTGLAIWSDLFYTSDIIGLDIDLNHFNRNLENLKKLGAFKRNSPSLFEFDQLIDNKDALGDILQGKKIDIFIDDGLHSEEAIIKTFESAQPHLNNEFVYIIEDNAKIHQRLRLDYPHLNVDSEGQLTILSPAS